MQLHVYFINLYHIMLMHRFTGRSSCVVCCPSPQVTISPFGVYMFTPQPNSGNLFMNTDAIKNGRSTQQFSVPVGSYFETSTAQTWFLTLSNMNTQPLPKDLDFRIRATCQPAAQVCLFE